MNNIIQLIASLSILVFIHELGHFFFARLFGARVEKFYLFFNPWFSIYKWQSKRSGTVYGLGWLPLGGYCQIAGMVDESMDTEQLKQAPKADEFRSKTTWQRLLIMAGGIIFNLVLAFFLYTMIAGVWGDRHLDTTQVREGWSFSPTAEAVGFVDGDIICSIDGAVGLNALDPQLMERMLNAKEVLVLRQGKQQRIDIPADMVQRVLREGQGFATLNVPFVVDEIHNDILHSAGLRSGDRVVSVLGVGTSNIQEVMAELSRHKGQDISFIVMREGVRHEVYAQLDGEGRLGVTLKGLDSFYPVESVRYNIIEAIPAGWNKALSTVRSYVQGLKHIFTKEGAKSLGGLGTMAKLFPKGFDWQAFWTTTAFLSIILAVMNLLPIPALDGGHIVFIITEMITGRKPNDKVMGYIQVAGMVLLFGLMIYANANDIYRYLIKG